MDVPSRLHMGAMNGGFRGKVKAPLTSEYNRKPERSEAQISGCFAGGSIIEGAQPPLNLKSPPVHDKQGRLP